MILEKQGGVVWIADHSGLAVKGMNCLLALKH
jgi:hypothetical protein